MKGVPILMIPIMVMVTMLLVWIFVIGTIQSAREHRKHRKLICELEGIDEKLWKKKKVCDKCGVRKYLSEYNVNSLSTA